MIACRYGLGMHDDFYTTLAQVLPVLLLAFIWDSAYLERLRGQEPADAGSGSRGRPVLNESRVRPFTLFVAALVVASIAITMLQLAASSPDSFALEGHTGRCAPVHLGDARGAHLLRRAVRYELRSA